MIIKTDQYIVINKAGNKILSKSAIRFHDIDKTVKGIKKHWHFRDFLFDDKADVQKTLDWIDHYSKANSINTHNKTKCLAMLKEGFIIKKASVVFNLSI